MLVLATCWFLAAGSAAAVGLPVRSDSLTPGSSPEARDAPTAADSLAVPDPRIAPDSLAWRVVATATVAEAGDGRGQVVEPGGIAADALGRVYVSDAALHRLQWFDRDGRLAGEAGGLGSDPGRMRRPGSVALLGSLGVAVLDRENRRVLSYDRFGELLGVAVDLADPQLEQELGRVDPSGLAVDRGGALYVVDAARERILAFDFSGRLARSIGGFGTAPGSFRGLRAVAVARRGELVTAERFGPRIQRLDLGGRPRASWILPGSRAGGGTGGLAVAVDDSGWVAVADEAAGTLWVFGPDGARLAARSGLGGPRALAFAPDRTLLVAETAPSRVRRFTLVPARSGAGGSGR